MNDETKRPGNVISLQAIRQVREASRKDPEYELRVALMDKTQLLEEMIRFQEERTRVGQLSLPMMVRGKTLFLALERNAETQALRALTSAYRRHLELEMSEYLAVKS